ncbi:hypothetical protein F4780DRAFT_776074 [Xylariomycetidae sp. FL0641]|nr:hypothetical protein F4780DRAFT_776074 [Xylariomycetidae sp. FL0641]
MRRLLHGDPGPEAPIEEMCYNIYLNKYCTGHGQTKDWELYSTQTCECGITPESIYRQPQPYFMFRCDDCVKNERFFENSPQGLEWRQKQREKEREVEEAKPRKLLKKWKWKG